VFNIGPLEFVVLAAVALIVFGPERLPQLTKDAARMIKTLRDLAQGARTQLTDELGPGFADFDLAKLNPRTAIRDALLGDDTDFSGLNPREVIQRAISGEDEKPRTPSAAAMGAEVPGPEHGPGAVHDTSSSRPSMVKATPPVIGLREGEPAPYDPDTT
jgi:sec-independent protein translocase protein TatB